MSSGKLKDKVDPWAFIRVKDERPTLLASLNSILPVIHKGVIAYNECTDGSDKIIEDFCRCHPGFKPFYYPHHVEKAGSLAYRSGELPIENTLAGYYNAVLDLIPKNEWVIKIDVDQIYFPNILEHSFYLPKNSKDVVFYSRLNVIVIKENSLSVIDYVRPGDHWLILNNGLHFENVFGKDNNGNFYSYERLKMPHLDIPFLPECSSIHFPFEKKYRKYSGNVTELQSFEDFMHHADRNEFSEDLLKAKEFAKRFDLV